MKNWVFIGALSASCLLSACGGSGSSNGSGAGTDPETKVDGFTITSLPNSDLQKAVKMGINGFPAEEGILRDGKRNGTWVVFHDGSNQPAMMASYVDNRYNGLYLEFDRNNQITLRAFYQNNLLDGYWARYSFGQKGIETTYKNGKLDGVYKEFRANGSISKEMHYKDGQLDGLYKFYDDMGNIILEYEYRNGKKI